LQEAGAAFVGILVIAVVVGVWAWMLALFKKGPRALLGYDKVIVHPFENIVLYRRGVFDRILSPGVHWIWPKNGNLIRIDMRPAVLQIAQGLVTSDQLLANMRCMARIQVKDPKAVIEGTQNYRDEVCARLQSMVRAMGKQRTFKDLHLNQDEFNSTAQKLATQAIHDIGCACTGFELLEAQSAGALTELEGKKMGFGPHQLHRSLGLSA
jgi:regulator of protease activity HflC (stomatin/prohibitin superfamily)